MIDKKDIRIGNLVVLTHESNATIAEIEEIRSNAAMVNISGELGAKYIYLDRLRPIELNPDWLRKLGFEVNIYDDDDDDAALVTLTGVFSMVPFYQKTRLLTISHAPKARKLKYVHELQNYIQALTGEELTIKIN